MTVYERTLSAVSQFGIPAAPQVYTGASDQYFSIDVQVTETIDGDDSPEYAYYQVTLSLFTPLRMDTVSLCMDVQQAIFDAGFSFPTVTPGGTALDGARKCQIFTFGRWDDWQSSISTTS